LVSSPPGAACVNGPEGAALDFGGSSLGPAKFRIAENEAWPTPTISLVLAKTGEGAFAQFEAVSRLPEPS
jgi:hypothetical protein